MTGIYSRRVQSSFATKIQVSRTHVVRFEILNRDRLESDWNREHNFTHCGVNSRWRHCIQFASNVISAHTHTKHTAKR